jgi:hypothetical protein
VESVEVITEAKVTEVEFELGATERTVQTEVVSDYFALDVMPDVKCWEDDTAFWVMAGIASVGFVFYGGVLPATLFRQLRAGVKAGLILDPEFVR